MITQQLTPLETLIDGAVTYAAFADAARAAFSGKSGEDVLSALTAVAHPLFPPEGRTPEAVAREIGRREVVALLLRASGNISPTPSHASRTSATFCPISSADLAADLAAIRSADQPIQPAAPAPETSADPILVTAGAYAGARQAILARYGADDENQPGSNRPIADDSPADDAGSH
jgi:hypothetical protein